MGRVFPLLSEGVLEIRRDIAKGTKQVSTRVQQRVGEVLPHRERIGYEYTLLSGIPDTVEGLVEFGYLNHFPLYQSPEDREAMTYWLNLETHHRLNPLDCILQNPADGLHPALAKSFEGNWPAYLYRERMIGAVDMMVAILTASRDSRRAYWPIYWPEDALRAAAPTRIPCSLGYQLMVRRQAGRDLLTMHYLQRSSDFDTFWLSDVFLARQFQLAVASKMGFTPGAFSHYIISFHSFAVEGTEIY